MVSVEAINHILIVGQKPKSNLCIIYIMHEKNRFFWKK